MNDYLRVAEPAEIPGNVLREPEDDVAGEQQEPIRVAFDVDDPWGNILGAVADGVDILSSQPDATGIRMDEIEGGWMRLF